MIVKRMSAKFPPDGSYSNFLMPDERAPNLTATECTEIAAFYAGILANHAQYTVEVEQRKAWRNVQKMMNDTPIMFWGRELEKMIEGEK